MGQSEGYFWDFFALFPKTLGTKKFVQKSKLQELKKF